MLISVLALFGLALAAPLVVRFASRWAGPLLALGPLLATLRFLSWAPTVAEGGRVVERYRWSPGLDVELSFSLDGLSLIFALLVCGIGTIVVLYTGGYLHKASEQSRFQSALLAFMASMLGVVVADHLIALFLFWELTSVTSYLLIGFHHEEAKSRRAALQALLITASGGLALLAAFLLLGQAAGSFGLSEILSRSGGFADHPFYTAILILVALGAFTKSAQFPFHFWLPGAMAAPSPASAYLHSSTMVKAGVYLLARLHPALGGTDAWFWLLSGCGGLTMLLGAFLAVRQSDLKRLLAFSTVSVLGMLVFLIGVGTPAAIQAALVLILAHAFYKGTLFLVTGAVDHATGTRDVRQLRGLARAMPLTSAAAVTAALSMAGFPFLLGFVAKEVALKALVATPLAWVLAAALATAGALMVSAALAGGVRPFVGTPSEPPADHEVPATMWLGPLLMAVASLLFGLWPAPIDRFLVSPAHLAIVGSAPAKALHAWYGFDAVLAVSALTWLAGFALFLAREPVRRFAPGFGRLLEKGPDRFYDRSLAALFSLADALTGFLQRGPISRHLRLSLGAIIALVGGVFWLRSGKLDLPPLGSLGFQELALAALLVAAAVVTALSTTRLQAVAALGVVGFSVALVYLYYGAPDLAMTQFVVETLTVVLVVLAFFHLPAYRKFSKTRTLVQDALLAIAGGSLMTGLVLFALKVQLAERISEYFAENSVPLGHGRNVVNVILVDFRALDTLGEITVLAIAGVGVYALLKLRPGKEGGA